MIAVGNVQAAPAAQVALVAMIEVLQAVEVVQIPEDGGVLAINFESVERLVPARVAGGLERGQ